ncbi:MAG: glycyl-radical enzyme activating protein [Prolixibacteraceae bacterium]|jgi:pyruvate formate lyase activating enzyme|nr:glycyl-radical enzyme activating protein [Prolixibacteraceae bacterium]
MPGIVFDIKRFAVHDGPGIRTTVHMKGCPLRCTWCHNPEGIAPEPVEVLKEIRMGNRTFHQKETVGKHFTVGELYADLIKDRVFWDESGGGVTFSGGEPLMQHDFLLEILTLLKENGIHTALDTSCLTSLSLLKEIVPLTDVFLADLKTLNDEEHIRFTGVSNRSIIQNIEWILQHGYAARLRIPVVPGVNFNDNSLQEFLKFVSNKPFESIDLLPFHSIASAKYKRFGMENAMHDVPSLSREALSEWKAAFEKENFNVNIGG